MDAHTFKHTVTYHGPLDLLRPIHAALIATTVSERGGITRTASVSKLRNLAPKPSTPKQDVARSVNWLRFQIAGAVGHLSVALSQGVRLPDPRDDADLREAVALLTAIRRRQEQRKNLNVEKKP